MKKIIVIAIIAFVSASAHAQLANTKWKDTLKLDNPIIAEFDFGKDTLTVTAIADGSLIETMTYTVEGDVFTITKISGQSDCDGATPGKYKFVIRGSEMYITVVSDACTDRSTVLDKTTFVKLP